MTGGASHRTVEASPCLESACCAKKADMGRQHGVMDGSFPACCLSRRQTSSNKPQRRREWAFHRIRITAVAGVDPRQYWTSSYRRRRGHRASTPCLGSLRLPADNLFRLVMEERFHVHGHILTCYTRQRATATCLCVPPPTRHRARLPACIPLIAYISATHRIWERHSSSSSLFSAYDKLEGVL